MSDVSTRKWSILAVVTLVSFITNLDGTIVIVGLPKLMEGLHIGVTTGLWALTAYIITSTLFLLPAGRWSDVIGSKKIFIGGLILFTIATILCGLAPSGTLLVVFRFLQGAGAALALATATPIIVRTFPSEQLGRALGINSTSWVIGSIIGPVAGGALVGTLGWRSIFFVTVPFAVLGMIGALVVLPDSPRKAASHTDWLGMTSFGLGLVSLLVAMTEGEAWGWTSVPIMTLFVGTLIFVWLFVFTEKRVKQPLFDLALLKHSHYTAGLGVTITYSIGYFATTFLLTIYLQGALHLNPLDAGLMLIPLSAPQLIMGPLRGFIADKAGPARLVIAGIALLAIGGFALGNLGTSLDVTAIVVPLLVMSAANGLAWPALTKAVMSSAPPQSTGSASGMFYTFRNVGMALSLTLALVVAELSVPKAVASQVFLGTAGILSPHLESALVHSNDMGFRVFVAFYLLALLIALVLLRPHRARAA